MLVVIGDPVLKKIRLRVRQFPGFLDRENYSGPVVSNLTLELTESSAKETQEDCLVNCGL